MFNEIPIKIPITLIIEIEKSTLKFIWKHKRPQITKAILSQKGQIWRHHNIRLQITLQSHSNENNMLLVQKQTWRPMTQNRRLRYKSMQLCPPDFWQSHPKQTVEEDRLFNKCCWENWIFACRKWKLDPCLSPCANINYIFCFVVKMKFKIWL
jgi:hypothetical protein